MAQAQTKVQDQVAQPNVRLVVNNGAMHVPTGFPVELFPKWKGAISTLYHSKTPVLKAKRGIALTDIFDIVATGTLPPAYAKEAAAVFQDAQAFGDISDNLRKKILGLYFA